MFLRTKPDVWHRTAAGALAFLDMERDGPLFKDLLRHLFHPPHGKEDPTQVMLPGEGEGGTPTAAAGVGIVPDLPDMPDLPAPDSKGVQEMRQRSWTAPKGLPEQLASRVSQITLAIFSLHLAKAICAASLALR